LFFTSYACLLESKYACMEQVLPLLFSSIIRTKESFSAFLWSSLLWISYYFTAGYLLVS